MSIEVVNLLVIYAVMMGVMIIQVRYPRYKWVKLPRKVRGVTHIDPIIFAILGALILSTLVQVWGGAG